MSLRSRVESLEIWKSNLVECETCKCLLSKSIAKKGNPEIRKKCKMNWDNIAFPIYFEDYIYYPYYCLKCYKPPLKRK